MKMNKKGFTLVELLAVIVILAVVMLIATTAVGPLMTKSRKSALGTEGIGLVDAAKMAYQAEQADSNSGIKATSSACFSLDWLYEHNYFEKSDADGYYGSVLVSRQSDGKYEYTFWIGNGTYAFEGLGVDYDVEDSKVVDFADGHKTSLVNCNGATGVVTCLQESDC